jgi:F-type H+-transporting ATPase subunit gamma
MAGQSMRDIKRRITSMTNTQQITKAMEMVSAAKLRRTQSRLLASRPFVDKLRDVLARLVSSQRSDAASVFEHPLLEVRETYRVLYVVVTADRGLAGGYNANLVRHTEARLRQETRPYALIAIGRKGRDALRAQGVEFRREYLALGDQIEYLFARELARELTNGFTRGDFDEVHVIYTRFVSAISHRPIVRQLLPISTAALTPEREDEASTSLDYIYSPSREQVIDILLPRYIETEVYQALTEAKTSEHGARMTAMRSASDNAGEMIDDLTLSFNRARQASITKEISEIVGGVVALVG